MYELKKDHFYIIQGFMITELNLKDCELLTFAIIHTITKSGGICVHNREYLAQFTGYSVRQVQRALNNLVAKKLISKEKRITQNGHICLYKSTYEMEVTLCHHQSDTMSSPSDNMSPKKENIIFNKNNKLITNIYKKCQNIDLYKYLIQNFSTVTQEMFFSNFSIIPEQNGYNIDLVLDHRGYEFVRKNIEIKNILLRQFENFNKQNGTTYNLLIMEAV